MSGVVNIHVDHLRLFFLLSHLVQIYIIVHRGTSNHNIPNHRGNIGTTQEGGVGAICGSDGESAPNFPPSE